MCKDALHIAWDCGEGLQLQKTCWGWWWHSCVMEHARQSAHAAEPMACLMTGSSEVVTLRTTRLVFCSGRMALGVILSNTCTQGCG